MSDKSSGFASSGAVSGLRVIDISTVIAGSMASSMLADHGAEVLKVEDPRFGDPIRKLEPQKDGISLWHKVAGRNKKSVTLKLSDPKGAALLKRLVAEADILIENFRPGTMEKWGLGWDALKAVNPKLVMVRISGYGQDGPYASRPGFGTIAESFAGLPIRTGMPGGDPMVSSFALSDNLAGLFAAFSAMFALYSRDHGTGEGQVIDVALHEPTFRVVEDLVIAYDQLGIVPRKEGNRVPWAAPRGVFQTSDGQWIAISAVSDQPVQRLLKAIGGEALVGDPRFATNTQRLENVDALEGLIRDWIGARTEEDALRELKDADVVAGELYDIERIVSDPHYAHRESVVTVDDAALGDVRVPGVVPKFAGTPGTVRHLGRDLGADDADVYASWLGLTDAEIEGLRGSGIIK